MAVLSVMMIIVVVVVVVVVQRLHFHCDCHDSYYSALTVMEIVVVLVLEMMMIQQQHYCLEFLFLALYSFFYSINFLCNYEEARNYELCFFLSSNVCLSKSEEGTLL